MTKAKRFPSLDAFVVFFAILILVGMVGQSVSVRLFDKWQRQESYEISFVVRSCDEAYGMALVQARENGDAVTCYYGKQAVGYLSVVKAETILSGEEDPSKTATLCSLEGRAVLYGREKDGKPFLYGVGAVSEGDVILLTLEKRAFALEITAINVLNVKKITQPLDFF